MQNKKILFFFALISLLLISFLLLSDETDGIPESSSYKLIWKGVTTTGNESTRDGVSTIDSIRSENYVLGASSGGQATSIMYDSLYSADAMASSYFAFPGFLKVWHDWRAPLVHFTGLVAADSAIIRLSGFDVTWTGIDTTYEDGQGWGVWYYSVSYVISSDMSDTSYLHLAPDTSTSDTIGEFRDEDLRSGDYVYFRLCASDLARNRTVECVYDTVRVITEMNEVIVQNDFGGGHVSVDGVWYPSPCTLFVIPGTEIELSDSSIYDYTDERHTFDTWDDGGALTHLATVNRDTIFTANYLNEYRLQVFNDGTWGGPEPPVGDHWYTDGEYVCAWITDSPVDDSIWCVGATGTGSVPPTVSVDSFCFNIGEPSSITWHWDTFLVPCTLHVSSRYGTPEPNGTVLLECGTEICAHVEAFDGTNRCTGWTGFGSVPSSGSDTLVCFTLTETSHLIWQWNDSTLLPFTVINPDGYGSPSPPEGVNWFLEGSSITASVTTPDGAYSQYAYLGSGDLEPIVYDESSVTFTLTMPTSIEWLWELTTELVTLTVTSPHGSPEPPTGTRSFIRGTEIDIYANLVGGIPEDTVYSGETRYISTGWSDGLGSVPESGDSSHFTFVISDDTEITWNWRTEHHIQLIYTGCGTATPVLSDSGWFKEDTVISLNAETPVSDGTLDYAFERWEPGDSILPTAIAPSGSTNVYGPETFIAYYGPGIAVRLMKIPASDTFGTFLIDSTYTIESNDTTLWFAEGSEHSFCASVTDSSDSVKYIFANWDDMVPNCAPRTITTDETYIAYYDQYWFTLVQKNPLADTYGSIFIGADEYPGSSTGTLWMKNDTSVTIQVLEHDYPADSCFRYEFVEWNDGTMTPTLSGFTFDSPTVLTANYDYQYRAIVRKDPPEEYGNIYIDSIVYPDSGRVVFWADSGDSHHIGVSKIDETADSTFAFRGWNDLSTDTLYDYGDYVYFDETRYSLCDSFVAEYDALSNLLQLRLYHPADGREWSYREGEEIDSTTWDLDTISINTTYAMSLPPTYPHGYLQIENLSNLYVDLGIRVDEVVGASWEPWYSSGNNRFVVRGQFNETESPPASYDFAYDRIKSDPTYATNGTDGIFGPSGSMLDPGSGALAGPENYVFLWLQLVTPLRSDTYSSDVYIKLQLLARTTLP
ncbi:MAG: hypothetical protein ACLFSQ_00500 [Candidatus Zixiibacteriota bacterium]